MVEKEMIREKEKEKENNVLGVFSYIIITGDGGE
jgi:hypothetical protein